MAFDDRGLRLEDDVVGLERGETGVKFLQREFRGDSVEEQDFVPRLLQHRRRGRGDNGEDVGRTRKPLELTILSEKSNALLTL